MPIYHVVTAPAAERNPTPGFCPLDPFDNIADNAEEAIATARSPIRESFFEASNMVSRSPSTGPS